MADSRIDRETSVYIAELAQKAEGMVIEMNNVAIMVEKLRENERNLLSVAYKNAIWPRLESWRILSAMEQDEVSRLNETNVRRINWYKLKVESEIIKICGDILSIIDKYFIPENSTPVDSLFYSKMKGDYNMYLAELKTGEDRKEYADKTSNAYKDALLQAGKLTAKAELPFAHPNRLGLLLNYSVFVKVIQQSPERACKLAKLAVAEANQWLNSLNDEEAKNESTNILRNLNDSIKLWESDMKNEGGNKHTNIAPSAVSSEAVMPEPDQITEDEDDDKDHVKEDEVADEDRKGVPKQSRSEKQNRKAMLKLEMEPVIGVSLVTIQNTNDILFEISKPDVFKSSNSETCIIFGEAKLKDLRKTAALAQADKEKEEVDESLVDSRELHDFQGSRSPKFEASCTSCSHSQGARYGFIGEAGRNFIGSGRRGREGGRRNGGRGIELVMTQEGVSRAKPVKARKTL